MRYLCCFLDSKHYTEPEFKIFPSLLIAYGSCIQDIASRYKTKPEEIIQMAEFDEKPHLSGHPTERIKYTKNNTSVVYEIFKIPENADHLLVWHHGYEGSGFYLMTTKGSITADTCRKMLDEDVEKELREDKEAEICFEDMDRTVVDCKYEWHGWSVVDARSKGVLQACGL